MVFNGEIAANFWNLNDSVRSVIKINIFNSLLPMSTHTPYSETLPITETLSILFELYPERSVQLRKVIEEIQELDTEQSRLFIFWIFEGVYRRAAGDVMFLTIGDILYQISLTQIHQAKENTIGTELCFMAFLDCLSLNEVHDNRTLLIMLEEVVSYSKRLKSVSFSIFLHLVILLLILLFSVR